METSLTTESSTEPLLNYVRIHRKRVGLSQWELGRVLGYRDDGSVSRHERFHSLPPLLIALGYEIVFQEPVSEIFAGLRDVVEHAVEQRLGEFESELRKTSGESLKAATLARKLKWLRERRSSDTRA